MAGGPALAGSVRETSTRWPEDNRNSNCDREHEQDTTEAVSRVHSRVGRQGIEP